MIDRFRLLYLETNARFEHANEIHDLIYKSRGHIIYGRLHLISTHRVFLWRVEISSSRSIARSNFNSELLQTNDSPLTLPAARVVRLSVAVPLISSRRTCDAHFRHSRRAIPRDTSLAVVTNNARNLLSVLSAIIRARIASREPKSRDVQRTVWRIQRRTIIRSEYRADRVSLNSERTSSLAIDILGGP